MLKPSFSVSDSCRTSASTYKPAPERAGPMTGYSASGIAIAKHVERDLILLERNTPGFICEFDKQLH